MIEIACFNALFHYQGAESTSIFWAKTQNYQLKKYRGFPGIRLLFRTLTEDLRDKTSVLSRKINGN